MRDLNIACGQDFHTSRPQGDAANESSAEVTNQLSHNAIDTSLQRNGYEQKHATAFKLLRVVPIVTPEMINNQVFEIFDNNPDLQIIPVVKNGIALGLITRAKMNAQFARPYLRELHGKKACTLVMDSKPMVTDKDTSLQDLSQSIVQADRHHLYNGFIITDHGQYLGMGTGQDLMREITQMQISAARYANPLTFLPGNVPINENIDHLLRGGVRFCACYVDLDHFKPFNDAYGYLKGDEVIQLASRILTAHCDPVRDFVGHIGGDDFIILFRSENWEDRCHEILVSFGSAITEHFSHDDCERGGYASEDRQGKIVFYPLVSVSLGVVRVEPGQYHSHHQVASATAEAKQQAKKIIGNSLFIDRRKGTLQRE